MYFLQIIVPLLSIAHAVPWDGPIPTQSPVYQDGALAKREPTDRAQGVSWSPAPMREPQDIFKAHAKRQTAVASSSKATTTSSKGPICGYVSGIGCMTIYPNIFLGVQTDIMTSTLYLLCNNRFLYGSTCSECLGLLP